MSRKGQAALIRMIVLFTLGSGAMAGITGYLIGTNRQIYTFTADQVEFIDGIATGSQYKADYENWVEEPADTQDPHDIRADPDTRCAGDFFPQKRMAMEGCLQALKERPPEGYRIPMG